MGQAKHRGPREARVAEALARTPAVAAPKLSCNHCQAALPEATPMDVSSLKGIEAAFTAHCTACDQDTWAVRGESAAVRAFYAALEKAAGQRVQLGTTTRATGNNPDH